MDAMSAVFFVAGPIFLGVMGVAMSVWPPEKVDFRNWKLPHWLWTLGFIVVAILTILAGVQQWRSAATSQNELITDVKELKQAVEALTKPLPKNTDSSRDPDPVYQNGEVVGNVIAPRITLSQSMIYFEQIQNAAKLDTSKPFEYRNFVLKLEKVESYTGLLVSSTDGVVPNVYQHVVSDIVRKSDTQ